MYGRWSDLSRIQNYVKVNYEDNTIEDIRSDCLNEKLKKNDPDQSSFGQAMSGDESEEYLKACEEEYHMLEKNGSIGNC